MKLATTDLNSVLEALTGLGSRMAKSKEDEAALLAAMSSVAKTIADEEISRDSSPHVSPKAFLSTTYARMKTREKIADSSRRQLAKQVFVRSIDEVKDRPEIHYRGRSKSPQANASEGDGLNTKSSELNRLAGAATFEASEGPDTDSTSFQLTPQQILETSEHMISRSQRLPLNDRSGISTHSHSPNAVHLKLFKQHRDLDRQIAKMRQREIAQRLSKEREACTFAPNSKTKGTRTPEDFVKHSMRWKEKNQQYRADGQKEIAKLEVKECRDKPQLSSRTQRLVKGKLDESVVKRLFEARSHTPPPSCSFHPILSINTQRLAEARAHSPLISRLYPIVSKTEPKVGVPRRTKTPTFKGDYDVTLNSYRLNSSRSPIPNLRFDLQSLPMEPNIMPTLFNA